MQSCLIDPETDTMNLRNATKNFKEEPPINVNIMMDFLLLAGLSYLYNPLLNDRIFHKKNYFQLFGLFSTHLLEYKPITEEE